VRFQSASYLTFCLSVLLMLSLAQGIDGRSTSYTTVEVATQKVESIPIPGTKAFPESITSTTDGTLYVGRVGDGGIVRIKPRTAESTVFGSFRATEYRGATKEVGRLWKSHGREIRTFPYISTTSLCSTGGSKNGQSTQRPLKATSVHGLRIASREDLERNTLCKRSRKLALMLF
jgi:hypothetical protein